VECLKFIEKYAKDKEQLLYMSWLSDAREFCKRNRDETASKTPISSAGVLLG
jgi:hypothetical protein